MFYTIQGNDILIANNKEALSKYYSDVLPLPIDYEAGKYIVKNGVLIDNTEAWEIEQARKEVERIAKLYLTGADVERGIYQARGMDFEDIVALVESLNATDPAEGEEGYPKIDVKALKIELKANHFYRGNPYVSAIGALLGFTEEQLDKFFETNDYTVLLPKEEPTEEPVGEEIDENITIGKL